MEASSNSEKSNLKLVSSEIYKISENDRQKAHELIRSFYDVKKTETTGKDKRTKNVKRTDFFHEPSGLIISSWRMNEWGYKKGTVPTMARGLFTRQAEDERYEIVIRGYNKFFNVGETKDTTWESIKSNTESPYELTIKENGCIIFIGGLVNGYLLVTSKNSIGTRQQEDALHAIKGRECVEKHLAKAGKSQADLATFLYENKLTAVAELCDDSFEEHVLPYPPEISGLYLHGLNYNIVELKTWPGQKVQEFAREWGFIPTNYVMKESVEEIKEFTDKVGKDYYGRAVEGFVVRAKHRSTGESFFFKIKYDEPYFMYRELREVTKAIINGKTPNFKYELTREYIPWVKEKLKSEPDIFKGYLANHGIFKVREMFLSEFKIRGDALNSGKLLELKDDQTNKGFTKTLIITIASIGCGKTSLSLALSRLFGFGHVQNDNNKKRLQFHNNINKLLETNNVVIADRNSHTLEHRKSLIEAIKSKYHNISIVALYWHHDLENPKEIFELTSKRVIERGENHQSLRPENPDFKKIMWAFIEDFEPLDSNNGVDDKFDLVIELDISSDLKSNIKIAKEQLKTILEINEPSEEEIDKTIEETFRYESTVKTFLARFFTETPNANSRTFFNNLQQNRRITPNGHVTLIHRAQLGKNPSEEFKELWEKCRQWSNSNTKVKLYLDKLISNSKVMALVIKGIEPSFIKSSNKVPHITVGTIDNSVKPREANAMCESVLFDKKPSKDVEVLDICSPIEIDGVVDAYNW